jgi:hypothetical protein
MPHGVKFWGGMQGDIIHGFCRRAHCLGCILEQDGRGDS